MLEERKQILEMLASQQISVEDAERLSEKLDAKEAAPSVAGISRVPRMLRIHVHDKSEQNINVQIPLALLRTGIKIGAMMPDSANEDLRSHGVDLAQLSEMDVDELIAALADFRVEIDGNGDESVRVFCE